MVNLEQNWLDINCTVGELGTELIRYQLYTVKYTVGELGTELIIYQLYSWWTWNGIDLLRLELLQFHKDLISFVYLPAENCYQKLKINLDLKCSNVFLSLKVCISHLATQNFKSNRLCKRYFFENKNFYVKEEELPGWNSLFGKQIYPILYS